MVIGPKMHQKKIKKFCPTLHVTNAVKSSAKKYHTKLLLREDDKK